VKTFVVGVDSVDSLYGGCTTHFTVFLIKKLLLQGYELMDLPHLVRLNQFIPWKTRGNASVGFIVKTEKDDVSSHDLVKIVKISLESYGGDVIGREPGIAVLEANEEKSSWIQRLYLFYKKAVHDYVASTYFESNVASNEISFWGGRGVLGAVAAIGYTLQTLPHTFELIAYRKPENMGKERAIIDESIKNIETKSGGALFNNYNYNEEKAVAAPRGPDPVLLGLRGVDPYMMIELAKEIELGEEPDAWMIFATNQHLDEHFRLLKVNELRTYTSGYIEGVVEENPRVYRKGHVAVKLRDDTGAVAVYFFSPTKPMNKIAMNLRRGDYIGVLGGAKPSGETLVFEAHKLWVYESPVDIQIINPPCPVCGHRLKSDGIRGMKCSSCGYSTPFKYKTVEMKNRRDYLKGIYTPLPGRINHLVRPSWIDIAVKETSYSPEILIQKLLMLSNYFV
jgi:tRNA(Ile2)-agmatinylcytidine synthase